MKTYIGTKIINAVEMSEHEFVKNKMIEVQPEDRAGYKVIYADGYESWSPKDVFEKAYREISDDEKKLMS